MCPLSISDPLAWSDADWTFFDKFNSMSNLAFIDKECIFFSSPMILKMPSVSF